MLPYDLKNITISRLSFSRRLIWLTDTLCFLLMSLIVTIVFTAMFFTFMLAAASLQVSEPQAKASMEERK
jgi:hypothetical protein